MAIRLESMGDYDSIIADFSQNSGNKFVTIAEGSDDTVSLNNEGENAAIISEDASGKKFIKAGAGGDTLKNNSPSAKVIFNGGAGDDTLTNTRGNSNATIVGNGGDDLISLTGSTGNVIQYTSGDGDDTIYGYDSTDNIQIDDEDYNISQRGQDVIINVGEGSIRLVNAKGTAININGDQESTDTDTLLIDNTSKSEITADSTIKIIDASTRTKNSNIAANALDNIIYGGTKKDTLYGGAGNDTIFGNNGSDELYGGLGNDSIIGEAGNDYLYGSAGSDTLIGGKGSDTFQGGLSEDVFVYSSGDGKDVIYDYTPDEDTIKIEKGTIKKVSLSGYDVILKIGSGQIKVRNGKGEALTIVNANGVSSVATFTDTMSITNSNSNSLKITDSLIKTINALDRTKAINITANSNANTIYSGKGNDTFTGGSGADVFVYSSGSGKDVITDYTVGQDKIKLTSGKITKTSISGSDVIFTVGSGNIKLKNAKNKAVNIIDSSNKSTSLLFGSTSPEQPQLIQS